MVILDVQRGDQQTVIGGDTARREERPQQPRRFGAVGGLVCRAQAAVEGRDAVLMQFAGGQQHDPFQRGARRRRQGGVGLGQQPAVERQRVRIRVGGLDDRQGGFHQPRLPGDVQRRRDDRPGEQRRAQRRAVDPRPLPAKAQGFPGQSFAVHGVEVGQPVAEDGGQVGGTRKTLEQVTF